MPETPGEKVRRLREQAGWTQEQLAKIADIADRTVRRVEAGGPISAETRKAIASAFNLDAAHLLKQKREARDEVQMLMVETGHDLLNALADTHGTSIGAEDTEDDDLAAIIKEVLGATEWSEIWNEISAEHRYDAGRKLSESLRQLRARGWDVACSRRVGTLRLNDGKEIPNWVVVTIKLFDRKASARRLLNDPTFIEETNEVASKLGLPADALRRVAQRIANGESDE